MSSLSMPKMPLDSPPVPEVHPALCTIVGPDREIVVPTSALTLAGFRAWAKSEDFPQRGRISFLDQELFIDMSPEELENHNKVKGEVGFGVANLNKRLKLGEYYPDRTLVTNVEAICPPSQTARLSPGKASKRSGCV